MRLGRPSLLGELCEPRLQRADLLGLLAREILFLIRIDAHVVEFIADDLPVADANRGRASLAVVKSRYAQHDFLVRRRLALRDSRPRVATIERERLLE